MTTITLLQLADSKRKWQYFSDMGPRPKIYKFNCATRINIEVRALRAVNVTVLPTIYIYKFIPLFLHA